MKENRDLSCERFVIQLDLTTSDVVATDEEVVELPFDAFPIFELNQQPLYKRYARSILSSTKIL